MSRVAAPLLLICFTLIRVPHASAEPAVHEFTAGASTFSYTSFFRYSNQITALDVGYYRHLGGTEGLWRLVRVGGGLRVGTPSELVKVPVEAYLRAQLTTRIGVWEGAAGPEVGLSGFPHLIQRTLLPMPEFKEKEDARLGPVYLGIGVAPLRFHLGRFTLSALEFQLSTTALPIGVAVRTQLGLLDVGVLL